MKGWFIGLAGLWMGMTGLAGAPAPDFVAAHKEAVEILTGFIRVDTSNPPGNETQGAQFLKAYLDKAGIPSQIFELEPRRGNLVARIKGNGKKKPLLLMGHIDVVGVEREKWTVEPFAGVIKDGFVYGRGAADDKGMTAVCLEIMLMLHRLKVPLDRDVIFLAEAGEESVTNVGIDYMVEKHWDKIGCEYALNEGGVIREEGGKIRFVGVSTTEKVPRPVLVSAKGTSGHGSKPRIDNAIVHLAAAVAKVGQWQPPMRLNETTREFFARLAKISPPEEAFLYQNLENPALSGQVQETLRQSNITYNAMLRTTISPNIIKGGFRVNVIPGDALATLDVRTLPDEDFERFLQTLRDLINDPAIEVVSGSNKARPSSPPSKLDSEMFLALERAQKRLFPDVTTIPVMLTGATDSAQLRTKGVQAYGIGSVMTEADGNRLHGNDERISVEGLRTFLEFVWLAVTDVAAAK
jgi:acetylornithine deacetylase/succinyl-diaminopimelate desuccinylase-like protein